MDHFRYILIGGPEKTCEQITLAVHAVCVRATMLSLLFRNFPGSQSKDEHKTLVCREIKIVDSTCKSKDLF